MTRRVVFTDRATLDIERIYDSPLERFGKRRADKAFDELYSHSLRFDLFPHRDRAREDIEPDCELSPTAARPPSPSASRRPK